MRSTLVHLTPQPLRPLLRKAYYAIADAGDRLRGRDEMIPPRSMVFVGAGDFVKTGEEFRRHFVELGGLQPDHQVLDVGCGIGRMAIPLTAYLSARGGYQGFDIVAKGIEWCRSRITPRFPNFQFQHADVYNRHYNPAGRFRAAEYRFPFDDGRFDFVFLTSVFTHMMPPDLEHYLDEIARVMKPGGRCLITFFVLDAEARELVRQKRSTLDFHHHEGVWATTDPADPEAAIAFDQDYVLSLFAARALRVELPIRTGRWCERRQALSYQDLVIAQKA